MHIGHHVGYVPIEILVSFHQRIVIKFDPLEPTSIDARNPRAEVTGSDATTKHPDGSLHITNEDCKRFIVKCAFLFDG